MCLDSIPSSTMIKIEDWNEVEPPNYTIVFNLPGSRIWRLLMANQSIKEQWWVCYVYISFCAIIKAWIGLNNSLTFLSLLLYALWSYIVNWWFKASNPMKCYLFKQSTWIEGQQGITSKKNFIIPCFLLFLGCDHQDCSLRGFLLVVEGLHSILRSSWTPHCAHIHLPWADE